jgi:hypothetical protein
MWWAYKDAGIQRLYYRREADRLVFEGSEVVPFSEAIISGPIVPP